MNTNSLSALFGRFASHAFPAWFQRVINHIYVRIFRIDLTDFAPIDSYPTLNALFTRKLIAQRAIDNEPNALISPSDSLITEQGIITYNRALQIKGMPYALSELLQVGESECEGYVYMNFYLSPRDYHRYHAPCDMDITQARYIGGELLPVNFSSLRNNANVFVRNERVVLEASTHKGSKIYFVAVGALNVGKMIFHFDTRINTNAAPNTQEIYIYSPPIHIKKGEELGYFQMGSTIVLVAQHCKLDANIGAYMRFGDRVGRLLHAV